MNPRVQVGGRKKQGEEEPAPRSRKECMAPSGLESRSLGNSYHTRALCNEHLPFPRPPLASSCWQMPSLSFSIPWRLFEVDLRVGSSCYSYKKLLYFSGEGREMSESCALCSFSPQRTSDPLGNPGALLLSPGS